jgi:hypothetical protein
MTTLNIHASKLNSNVKYCMEVFELGFYRTDHDIFLVEIYGCKPIIKTIYKYPITSSWDEIDVYEFFIKTYYKYIDNQRYFYELNKSIFYKKKVDKYYSCINNIWVFVHPKLPPEINKYINQY